MDLSSDERNDLLFVNFNQDSGCFATGTNNGFCIYNVEPFQETFKREFPSGGIGIVEMLFRCNLLALVGGGRNPRYPRNKVMIWDDHQNRCIGELSFRNEVCSVRLRRDKVVVALASKVYVYRFSDLRLLDQIDTYDNPRGLIAISVDASSCVLACPGPKKGHVAVELSDIQRTNLIAAHEAELAAIALNSDGTRLATSSNKGTLIRVFDTHTGDLLQELRRGMDHADVNCICFNNNCSFLACASDKGTVHIFSLNKKVRIDEDEETKASIEDMKADKLEKNRKSGFSLLGKIIPGTSNYLGSEWSCAQVRGLDVRSLCAFGTQPHTLAIIGADGSFRMVNFENGGESEQISYENFLSSPDGLEEDDDDSFPRQHTVDTNETANWADRGNESEDSHGEQPNNSSQEEKS
mmetsp:Transcript_28607/g.37474  ORF Transcript_28607/g.37474 Transcript_28607/m.37474 type:complete len:409 (+) Transcript_28607:116-1342(+)|eukprot:CAMPEP_0117746718 /NCGR_PEP_ID=MMETSP0947-20121206/8105_1 /TAXON_ID=44440 /ORGANISM="Chattonella subsalsa, Strain CCMP2191" /LENGTH=408 /DNA_ID=CAMNT_0005564079 /DNA_START=33 /DNA_END=1259 /DNA_ORIENTATION=-